VDFLHGRGTRMRCVTHSCNTHVRSRARAHTHTHTHTHTHHHHHHHHHHHQQARGTGLDRLVANFLQMYCDSSMLVLVINFTDPQVRAAGNTGKTRVAP
jgi:hypothetical protein